MWYRFAVLMEADSYELAEQYLQHLELAPGVHTLDFSYNPEHHHEWQPYSEGPFAHSRRKHWLCNGCGRIGTGDTMPKP